MSVANVNSPAALHGLGEPIPDTAHAVSVSLPSWRSNVGYEEGEDWVVNRMRNGYPRFFIHLSIVSFQNDLLDDFGRVNEQVLLFPSTSIARRCASFISRMCENRDKADCQPPRIVELRPVPISTETGASHPIRSVISAVFFDKNDTSVARKFWQHTGDGISSRRAEFFHSIFKDGRLTKFELHHPILADRCSLAKGPKRYRRDEKATDLDSSIVDTDAPGELGLDGVDYLKFVEERFGRNLDVSLATKAKLAIRRRIAGSLTSDNNQEAPTSLPTAGQMARKTTGFSEDQVYLFPCGMSAIYNTHRILMNLKGNLRSIMFGFPYTDTLKVLERFGPGAAFYGNGSSSELDDIERRCNSGERFLALFCEFPGNPLLKTPDLRRIRQLADQFDFLVVVDETIGNFLNVNVLHIADVVVSSLTKVFSGDSNVMGGSMVLNPRAKRFEDLSQLMKSCYVDHFWLEDAIFLERNSRDFVQRNRRTNENAEAIASLLKSSPKIKAVNYPKFSSSKAFYDEFRNFDGGYSGLLSTTFHSETDAIAFYDALATAKGPSLGSNFTLSSPFVILAHYYELEWVRQFGVEPELVRISVGLENTQDLLRTFQLALEAIPSRPIDIRFDQ